MTDTNKQWLSFQCEIHNNIITADLLAAFRDRFPAVYFEAEAMTDFLLAIADRNQEKLVMLPFDYMAEAMAMGAEATGFADVYGLRGTGKLLEEAGGLLALPRLDVTKGRLGQIIKAVSMIAERGYTPCLNLSGFLAIGDVLLSTEKVFLAWRGQKQVLFTFYQRYTEDLVRFADRALQAGAKVISYSDPLSAASLIGPKMAKEMGRELLIPLLQKLVALPYRGIIHVCGVSTAPLAAAGTAVLRPRRVAVASYQQVVIKAAEQTEKMEILAYGCLNRKRTTEQLVYVTLAGQ